MDRKELEALAAEQQVTRKPAATVIQVDETHLTINGHPYELVSEVHQGFDLDAFSQRFSTVLSKFDYIVGDWGFEQLRLRGFFTSERAAAKNDDIDTVQDYLLEDCNFGCAYFILHNQDVKPLPKPRKPRVNKRRPADKNERGETVTRDDDHASQGRHRRSRRGRRKPRSQAYTEQRVSPITEPSKGRQGVTVETGGKGRRHFTIRKKETD